MSNGGIRPPDYIYEMAISRIEDLMVQGVPWPRLFATLVDEGITESEDTAKKWRGEVMRRWAAEEQLLRPARKDLWRARLEHLYNDLLERARAAPVGYAQTQLFSEAIKTAKLGILIDGAHSPITVKHEGRVDVAAMSPHEREQEIAALLAKRDAARGAKAPEGGN